MVNLFYYLAPVICLSISLLCQFPSTAQADTSAVYRIRKGDNLSVIAKRYGVTVNSLRQTNNLKSDVIFIGNKLRISEPFHRSQNKTIEFSRPVSRIGKHLREFGPYKSKGMLMPSSGVDVAAAVGTRVRAPADAVVRHVGELEGLGTVLILEHGGDYATVFYPLDPTRMDVAMGQAIRRGDSLGFTDHPQGDDDPKPYLHLELRKSDQAIDPQRLLK